MTAGSATVLCLVGAVIVIGFVILMQAIRIVREYQRLVVFRLGRVLSSPRGPGIVFLIPIVDRPVWVDLRGWLRTTNSSADASGPFGSR